MGIEIDSLPSAISLDGTESVPIVQGGTTKRTTTAAIAAQTTPDLDTISSTQGAVLYRSATAWEALSPGTSGYLLQTQGAGANPAWAQAGTVFSVAISGGTTGISVSGSPITTSGTITLSGTLVAANGGTGIASYTIGDILYASGATALSKLAGVATGNVLLSGGVATAPAWGQVGLTTHVTGTLPVANGGTNSTSIGSSGQVLYNSSGSVSGGTGTTWNNATQSLRIDGASAAATYGTLNLSKTGGASSVLDLEHDYSGKVLRVLGPPDIAGRDPVTYIGNGGEISTRAWLRVSGSTTGTGDGYVHDDPLNAGTYPQMVSIWADVKHALMIRPFNSAGGLPLTSLDRSGNFRFGWREYGEMGWGPSSATDETGWDVGLIRGTVNQLYVTDGQSTATASGYLYALGIGTGDAGGNLKIEYGYVAIRGDGELRWGSVADSSSSTKDIGVHRSAAGVLGIHDGITTTTYRDLKLRNMETTGSIELGHASDTTLSRSSAGVIAVEGVTVSLNSTSATHTAGTIELGNASDTTLARSGAGDVTIEGNAIYRAGGTDVPVTDGGTGVSTLTNHGVLLGQGTSAVAATSAGTSGHVLTSGGASADPSFASISTALDVLGSTQGQVLYRNASAWVALAAGTSGQVLQSGGAGANPSWATVAGTGDVTAASTFGTDNVLIRSDGTSKGVQSTGITVADTSNDMSGVGSITPVAGSALRTDTSAGNTLLLQARDVDGAVYTTFATLTANNTPTMDLSTAVTMGGNAIYYATGTDVPVTDGGTGASTAAGAATNLGLGTGDSPEFTAVNVGHASDTTITRSSAGVIAVEGETVHTNSTSRTLTASTIELGAASDTTISRTGAGAIAVEGVGVALNSTSLTHTASTIELGHASDTTLSRSAAGELAVEGTLVKKVGLETIWIPAAAMTARTTNGAASGTAEMTTNKNMFATLDFDTTTQEFAQFCIRMPKSWNESTVTFAATWSHASTATNFGVAWGLAGVAISNDDAGDVAFGTAVIAGGAGTGDTGGTTNDIYITPTSAAITIAGTPAAEDYVMFQVNRTVSDSSDNMAIDARLHGITLYFTTDASTDA